VVGRVQRHSEVNNAVGEYAAQFPDMTTYGEGQPGVWAIGSNPAPPDAGRSFRLTDPADLDWLAQQRAGSQPELEPGLVAHLGEHYSSLKASQGGSWAGEPMGRPDSDEPGHEPWAAAGEPLAHAAPADGPASDGPANTTTSLEKLDWPMDEAALPPDLREKLAALDATAARTRQINAESDAIQARLPVVEPEKRAAAVRERWKAVARETVLPPEIREQLIAMIAGGQPSARAIARAFEPDITRNEVNLWLHSLREEGVIVPNGGKGPASGWMLATEAAPAGGMTAEGDDAQ
jgi:hypothetical protein